MQTWVRPVFFCFWKEGSVELQPKKGGLTFKKGGIIFLQSHMRYSHHGWICGEIPREIWFTILLRGTGSPPRGLWSLDLLVGRCGRSMGWAIFFWFISYYPRNRSKKTDMASEFIMGCWPVGGLATLYPKRPPFQKSFWYPWKLTARDFTWCPENHHMFIGFDMIWSLHISAKQIADLLGSQLPWGHEFLVELSKAFSASFCGFGKSILIHQKVRLPFRELTCPTHGKGNIIFPATCKGDICDRSHCVISCVVCLVGHFISLTSPWDDFWNGDINSGRITEVAL